MLAHLALLFSTLLLANASDIPVPQACAPTDTALVGQLFTLTKLSANCKKITPGAMLLSGNINITSGCSFQAQNFVLNPPNGQLFWYGVPKQDTTQIWKLSNVAIGTAAGGPLDYSPINARWSDMVAIGPYSEQYKVFAGLATWNSSAVQNIMSPDDEDSSAASISASLMLTSVIALSVAMLV